MSQPAAAQQSDKYQFHIASDLKKFGTTEGGEDYIGEVFFLIAQDESGKQFAYNQLFPGCEVETFEGDEDSEGGIYFNDIRESAKEQANAVMAAEIAKGSALALNEADWRPTHAVYGSQSHDEQEAIDWERDRDGMF